MQQWPNKTRFAAKGFTLLDILVAIAVISILVALLTPTLSRVQETSRRVVCASNLRQIGMAVQTYSDDHRGFLPASAFIVYEGNASSRMMTIRLGPTERRRVGREGWDGLGILYSTGHMTAPGIFYCPSHAGDHPFSQYDRQWAGASGEIVGNYHFRGEDSAGQRNLMMMSNNVALTSDGMRTQADFNHREGLNVLRAGLHVGWVPDSDLRLLSMRPDSEAVFTPEQDDSIEDAWRWLDQR